MLMSIAAANAVSMITSPGIGQYATSVVIGFIALLCLREALSGLTLWNERIKASFNMAIIPLALSFAGIVLFMIVQPVMS